MPSTSSLPDGECYCGCTPGAHMGKPRGCTKHGFHEFIRASWVPGADLDAPACVTCGHAQAAHPEGGYCVGWTADGAKCGHDGYEPEKPKDSLPRGGAEGVHVHEWGEWRPGQSEITRDLEYAYCPCGASKARKRELDKPQEPVCTHCQGPHALEDCKGLEASEEGGCAHCGEAHDWRDCKDYEELVESTPPPRRPPYAVAYAVEGGAQYEVAVSGDATVVAEDGALHILHPKKPVLAIVRIQPMNMEES